MLQKAFNILATSSNVLYNYFNDLHNTKLFSDLYLFKFLDTLEKLFFPYINNINLNN